MNTLAPLPVRPAGPLRAAATARTALWLDCRRTTRQSADQALAEAADTVRDMLPPDAGDPAPAHRSARGTIVVGPVHGLAAYQQLMRRLLPEATASPGRAFAVEYPLWAVDALVDARLDLIGGCEAKAMRSTAGIAGAHLLYDAWRRDVQSPQWARAAERGATAPYLLWTTQPCAGPDRGAAYAGKCLFPGTALALSPTALRTFAQHGVVTGPSAVDITEARRVARVLDWFGIRLDTLEPSAAQAATSA
ncbi:hypothetical protein ABZX38_21305 [Streptomyces longwoodensis]|uniref:hypothetical protein n=1 Tax=Streptomyces longwoodensis TaxID=68231 RepID=UPI0033B6EABB